MNYEALIVFLIEAKKILMHQVLEKQIVVDRIHMI